MPIQFAILAVMFALLLGGFGGYAHGKKIQRGEAAEETTKAFVALIDNSNKAAKADTEAAVKAEAARQSYKRVATERKARALEDAMAKAKSVCDRDPQSFGLLIEAVKAANGDSNPTPGPVPAPVR